MSGLPITSATAVAIAAVRADERAKVFRACREAICLACARGRPAEHNEYGWWHDHESCLAGKLRDLEAAAALEAA